MADTNPYDVIIIGGSYAGLSAAMTLGRSMRKTLVIDHGQPCNQQTPHSHNFLTQDGKTPFEISSLARDQVTQYSTVSFYNGAAVSGKAIANGFEITTDAGKVFIAKKLVVATGIKDELPAIPGMKECWGISVIHCPYCHGYEVRNQRTALLANSDRAVHLGALIHNLTKDLTILTNGDAAFTEEQKTRLNKNNILVVETRIIEIAHSRGRLSHVVFDDGTKLALDALYAAVPFVQHSDIPVSLGCELTQQGHLKIDTMQKTNIPGVFACGDNSSPMRSVANAVASGNFAGAAVNAELAQEEF